MPDPRALEAFGRLIDIMHRLRAPGGCPWDREQTPASLRPYLLEETYEVLDALALGNDAAICDELGDLLLQVVFHAELAAESQRFSVADVATAIADKLVRRHPHVFGDVIVHDAADVLRNWQQIKAQERGDTAVTSLARVEAVSRSLPALSRADEVGRKAGALGFDWRTVDGVRAKVAEELAEVDEACIQGDPAALHHEVGDLLLSVASLGRHLGVSPELALRDATERFLARVRRCDTLATAQGLALAGVDEAERDRLWELAKAFPSPTDTTPD